MKNKLTIALLTVVLVCFSLRAEETIFNPIWVTVVNSTGKPLLVNFGDEGEGYDTGTIEIGSCKSVRTHGRWAIYGENEGLPYWFSTSDRKTLLVILPDDSEGGHWQRYTWVKGQGWVLEFSL